MLARRMLTFVAVLLALTALAAAFAPPPPRDLSGIGSLAPGSPPGADTSDVVDSHLDADRKQKTTITLEQGDRLHLEVSGTELDAVELRGLGPVRPLAPDAFAVFDVLADEPGSYPIVLTISGRTIGTIEVIPPRRKGLAPAEPLTHRTRDT
jgi:hypothetical protein